MQLPSSQQKQQQEELNAQPGQALLVADSGAAAAAVAGGSDACRIVALSATDAATQQQQQQQQQQQRQLPPLQQQLSSQLSFQQGSFGPFAELLTPSKLGSLQLLGGTTSAPTVLQPQPSGASSPTAASEHSIATTHASTSSTVPFSHIAHQRKQQERDDALHQAANTMMQDAAAAFDLRMQSYVLDITALQEINDMAAEQYSSTAELAAALGQFVSDLGARQAAAKEALAVLPQLDRQLQLLETAVTQLDRRSKQLETRLGVGTKGGSRGQQRSGTANSTSNATSSSSSAYSYLASSVTQLSVAGVSGAAAAGLGCLKGVVSSASGGDSAADTAR